MIFSDSDDNEKIAALWLQQMNWNIWGSVSQYREQILNSNVVDDAPSDEGKFHLLLAIMAGCHFAHMIELSEDPSKLQVPKHNTYPAVLAIQHKKDINIVTVSNYVTGGLYISAIWQHEKYVKMMEKMIESVNGNRLITKYVQSESHMLHIGYVQFENAAESMIYQPTWDRVGDDEKVSESVSDEKISAFSEFLKTMDLDLDDM